MPPTTRPVLRALEQTYRQPTIPRAPWICASCQTNSQPKQRTFTTTRPRRSKTPPNHYDLFPQTFPSGAPPSTPFSPDLSKLRREFLTLQQKSHPDLAPNPSLKPQYEAQSALINEAYRTLLSPLKRAQYLLSQAGIDVEDESSKLSDGQGDAGLLMEVMEAREAVEEVEDEEGLVGIREENQTRIDESVKVLEQAFAEGNLDKAAQEAVKLRYWMNIEESIQGWEKGKGGGVIHH